MDTPRKCRTCQRERLSGALYCGTCIEVRFFEKAESVVSPWVRKALAGQLPPRAA